MDDPVWIENVVFPLVMMGMTTLAGFGLYRIVMRWIDRKHERLLAESRGAPVEASLAGLQGRVEMLEEVVGKMQDLEERLDFTERLLTQQQRDRLPSAGPGDR
ncbi:MAG TPA: hypothetical protein VD793_04260 [Gemmatimonadales bacterium]|nr:hypothetical protein [Gemmatimonadales bacterium]